MGKCALGYQLYAMGFLSRPRLDSDSSAIKVLVEMFERMGDCLALQYGGQYRHLHHGHRHRHHRRYHYHR